ncbi:MAG TPA: hypothetical protein VE973_03420 [Candidatus Limnocylindria bacterium]|nr:hypothetical protein [Candidatus Limnocylindria bacterium]
MIIGLVGEKLSGKDTVALFLAQEHKADHFKFSQILDSILNMLNLDLSRRNEIDLGLALRGAFGPHVLINALKNKVEKSSANLVVVNGIRMDEFEIVKAWDGAKTIYITAPVEERFERYKQRHEKVDDAVMDFEHFKAQEQEQTEVGIPALGARADFKIENTGSLEELYGKVNEIIKQFK